MCLCPPLGCPGPSGIPTIQQVLNICVMLLCIYLVRLLAHTLHAGALLNNWYTNHFIHSSRKPQEAALDGTLRHREVKGLG